MDKATKVFLDRIDAAVAQHALLDHPFYQLWNRGELPREALDEYSRQYYAHVRAFPTYVSAVHSRCNAISVRQLLLDNLIEEEQGPDNHPELWLRFAEGLGVSRESAQEAEPLDSTRDSVTVLRNLCDGADYRNGVAALYAYESQVPDVSRTKREGLAKYYALDDHARWNFSPSMRKQIYDIVPKSVPSWPASAGTQRAVMLRWLRPVTLRRRYGNSWTASTMRMSSRARSALPRNGTEALASGDSSSGRCVGPSHDTAVPSRAGTSQHPRRPRRRALAV